MTKKLYYECINNSCKLITNSQTVPRGANNLNRHFTKESMNMANKQRKLLAVSVEKNKTIRRYRYILHQN